jgi:Ca2+-binding RTX toxin-like protein
MRSSATRVAIIATVVSAALAPGTRAMGSEVRPATAARTVQSATRRAEPARVKMLTGALTVAHGDDFVHDRMDMAYSLRTVQGMIDVTPSTALARTLHEHVGHRVMLSGTFSGSVLHAQDIADPRATDTTLSRASTLTQTADGDPTTPITPYLHVGVSKIAVVLMSFATEAQTTTVDQARQAVFTGSDSAESYFNEVSGGQISLTGNARADGDVFGPYTMDASQTPTQCSIGSWYSAAQQAITNAGQTPSSYGEVIIDVPHAGGCGWGGVMAGPFIVINGVMGTGILAHELGHAFGLGHAASYTCMDPSGANYVASSANCSSDTYGDPFDAMGDDGHHYHGWNLLTIGVMPSSVVKTITASGTYTLTTDESYHPNTNELLRIPRQHNADGSVANWFTLELREPYGQYDADIPTGVYARIEPLHQVVLNPDGTTANSSDTQLLDATPETSRNFADAALAPGRSITDPTYGITITTLSISGTTAQISVTLSAPLQPTVAVNSGVLDYTTPSGLVNQPTFTQTGATTVTVTDGSGPVNVGAGCTRSGTSDAICTGVISIYADLGDMNDTATVVGSIPANLQGGPGNDTLQGGMGNDTLNGGDGNDTLVANATPDGVDTYIGGPGEDRVSYGNRTTPVYVTIGAGGDGAPGENDYVSSDVEEVEGGSGNDVLIGNAGNNVLLGDGGSDFLEGGAGADYLDGGGPGFSGTDRDVVSYADHTGPVSVTNDDVANDGSPGEGDNVASDNAVIVGTNYNDVFTASPYSIYGTDFMGGGGNDVFAVPQYLQPLLGGNDVFDGGPGNDTISYAGRTNPLTIHLPDCGTPDPPNCGPTFGNGEAGENNGIANMENAIGGAGNDTIYGNSDNNVLIGGDGNDVLYGMAGDDDLVGGNGNDTLWGGIGRDTADYSDHTVPVTVMLNASSWIGNESSSIDNDSIATDVENVTGGSGNDTLVGNSGDNVLNGGPGNDYLAGGPGNDTLTGGPGSDTMRGGGGNDIVSYLDHTSSVSVALGNGVATTNNGSVGENDTIYPDIQTVIGGTGADRLIGNNQNNVLWAPSTSAADWIEGGAGNDTLIGGNGNDIIMGEGGSDIITGGKGKDILYGDGAVGDPSDGNDTIYAIDGAVDTINCGGGSNDVAHIDFTPKVIDTVLTGCETLLAT